MWVKPEFNNGNRTKNRGNELNIICINLMSMSEKTIFMKKLPSEMSEKLIDILEARFKDNMQRHRDLAWSEVQAKLESDPAKLWSLHEMEKSGGEPDVIGFDPRTGEFILFDCSPESPAGRRNLCYDREGQEGRKSGGTPAGNAVDMAATMGIELLTESQYRALQRLGDFDTKTSSWVKTPAEIRKLGGALFADRRYNQVFVYHNGAPSYYAVRGFRGSLRI